MIDFQKLGLTEEEVLMILYNNATPNEGSDNSDMSIQEAKERLLEQLSGRVPTWKKDIFIRDRSIHLVFEDGKFEEGYYDYDRGPGAAKAAIEKYIKDNNIQPEPRRKITDISKSLKSSSISAEDVRDLFSYLWYGKFEGCPMDNSEFKTFQQYILASDNPFYIDRFFSLVHLESDRIEQLDVKKIYDCAIKFQLEDVGRRLQMTDWRKNNQNVYGLTEQKIEFLKKNIDLKTFDKDSAELLALSETPNKNYNSFFEEYFKFDRQFIRQGYIDGTITKVPGIRNYSDAKYRVLFVGSCYRPLCFSELNLKSQGVRLYNSIFGYSERFYVEKEVPSLLDNTYYQKINKLIESTKEYRKNESICKQIEEIAFESKNLELIYSLIYELKKPDYRRIQDEILESGNPYYMICLVAMEKTANENEKGMFDIQKIEKKLIESKNVYALIKYCKVNIPLDFKKLTSTIIENASAEELLDFANAIKFESFEESGTNLPREREKGDPSCQILLKSIIEKCISENRPDIVATLINKQRDFFERNKSCVEYLDEETKKNAAQYVLNWDYYGLYEKCVHEDYTGGARETFMKAFSLTEVPKKIDFEK